MDHLENESLIYDQERLHRKRDSFNDHYLDKNDSLKSFSFLRDTLVFDRPYSVGDLR